MIEILRQKLKYLKFHRVQKKKNTRLSNLEKEEESQEFLVFSNNLF